MHETGHEPLLIGTGTDCTDALARQLGARFEPLPSAAVGDDAELQGWRDGALTGPEETHIIVMAWSELANHGTLNACAWGDWLRRAESALTLWFTALGRAQRLIADGGSVVAVVERPAPLDCAGHAPETAVAEGVAALVRSLARAEGGRRVRFNCVTTPLRMSPDQPVAPAPALERFPGSLDQEVAGAVRMLLGNDSCGLTGTVLHADCGRSW